MKSWQEPGVQLAIFRFFDLHTIRAISNTSIKHKKCTYKPSFLPILLPGHLQLYVVGVKVQDPNSSNEFGGTLCQCWRSGLETMLKENVD